MGDGLTEQNEHTDIVQPQPQGMIESTLDTDETKRMYVRTVQYVTWILGGIGGVALVGVLLLAGLNPSVPESVIVLAGGVATAAVSGLVGFIGGTAARNA